jgi:hypothetical protein
MSYVAPDSAASATTKVARLTQAVRRNWTQARLADREVMALRTNLTRVVG